MRSMLASSRCFWMNSAVVEGVLGEILLLQVSQQEDLDDTKPRNHNCTTTRRPSQQQQYNICLFIHSKVTSPRPEGNRSFTDFLVWGVDTYDFAADWYSYSADRLQLGLTFPESWFDSSIFLVGKKHGSSGKSFDLWSWLMPFSSGVWVMLGVTVFVGGLSFWLIVLGDPLEKKCFPQQASDSFFVAAMAFTKKILHKPMNTPARVVTFAALMWEVVISSAYTANLASALVARNQPSLVINGVDDAVRYGLKICTFAGGSQEAALRAAYPQARIEGKSNPVDLYAAISRGECSVTLTGKSSWDLAKYQNDVNPTCDLDWVGRTISEVPAGFTTMYADSGTLCTNVLRDVMSLHFREMKYNGFINQAWNELYTRTSTVTCNPESGENVDKAAGNEDALGQMTLLELGGIFILYYAVMVGALLYVYVPGFIRKIACKDQTTDNDDGKDGKEKTVGSGNQNVLEETVDSIRSKSVFQSKEMFSNMASFLSDEDTGKDASMGKDNKSSIGVVLSKMNEIEENMTQIMEILAEETIEA